MYNTASLFTLSAALFLQNSQSLHFVGVVQSGAEHSRTKRNRVEKSKVEKSRVEQSGAEHSRAQQKCRGEESKVY